MAPVFAVCLCNSAAPKEKSTKWRIEGVSLAADTEPAHKLPDGSAPNKLTAAISSTETRGRFELSTDVRLTEIADSFIWGDRLAVLGRAGRASAVVIFDLARRQMSDWFFCIEPRRIAPGWIAYVEWYPRLFGEAPREVVLIYDLDKAPAENRLPIANHVAIPAPVTAAPVLVGMPVYPEINVQERSYANVVENPADNETVLAYLSFLLLPQKRLVFVAAEGQDFMSSRDFLVVVNLSLGINHPVVKSVGIPKDQLEKPGENPQFVKITGIEPIGENSVRLLVPKSEYGVSSIVVNLNR